MRDKARAEQRGAHVYYLCQTCRGQHRRISEHCIQQKAGYHTTACCQSSSNILKHNLQATRPNVEQQPDPHQINHHRTTTGANKRQRNASNRHDPNIHAHVNQDVEKEHRNNATSNQAAIQIFGLIRNFKAAPDQQQITQ